MRAPTLILAVDALLLGVSLVVLPPGFGLLLSGPAGALGVVACELLDRLERRERTTNEPWRLDGWMVLVGTLGVLGLGLCIGAEAVAVAWLLAALLAGLGFASLPNLAPPHRP